MKNVRELKQYIDYLKANRINNELALELLKQDKSGLDAEDKNLIYAFCYPRPLEPYALPDRVQKRRREDFSKIPIQLDLHETTLILEAAKTIEYGNFIKHLFMAFCNNPKCVHPVIGVESDECAICGSAVHEAKKEGDPKELAFSSDRSSIILCKWCLYQLYEAYNMMKVLDPNFLYKWN